MKLEKREARVNIHIDIKELDVSPSDKELAVYKRYFKRRPVEVVECSQYAAVTLVAKRRKK